MDLTSHKKFLLPCYTSFADHLIYSVIITYQSIINPITFDYLFIYSLNEFYGEKDLKSQSHWTSEVKSKYRLVAMLHCRGAN